MFGAAGLECDVDGGVAQAYAVVGAVELQFDDVGSPLARFLFRDRQIEDSLSPCVSPNLNELSRLDGTKSKKARRNVRENVFSAARLGSNQQNRDVAPRQVLLELHALIERDEYFELALRQSQQLTIRSTTEPSFRDRRAFVALDG